MKKKGYSLKDPLFPRSKDNQTSEVLSFQHPVEVLPVFWRSTDGIRSVFKSRSKKAGLKYFPPRAFRHTTANTVIRNAKNGSELKAVSQHFGHEDVRVTLQIYGNYGEEDLIEVLDQIEFSKKPIASLEGIDHKIDKLHEEIIKDRNTKSETKN